MKRAFNVRAVKRAHSQRIPSEPLLPSDLAQKPESFTLSRRHALGLAGALSVTAAPLASAIEGALATSYRMVRRGQRIAFIVAGIERWVIDPRWFDGSPTLNVSETDGEIHISLQKAFFPGTTVPADFTATITNSLKPELSLSLTKLGALATAPFIPWLLERARTAGTVKSNVTWQLVDSDIEVVAGTSVYLRPTWTLRVDGKVTAQVVVANTQRTFAANNLDIQLPLSNEPSLHVPSAARSTIARLHRGSNEWDVALHMANTESWNVRAANDAFDTLTLESSSDARLAMVFEGAKDSRVTVDLADYDARIGLRNVRYGLRSTDQGVHEILVADYSQTPQWMVAQGISLEIGHKPSALPVHIERLGDRLVKCSVTPGLLRYTIPIDGAITQPTRPNPNVHLALLPLGAPAASLPKPSAALASLQLGDLTKQIGNVSAQDIGSQFNTKPKYTVKKDLKRVGRTAVKIPWLTLASNPSVTVIRPDDLLVLTFEFDGLTINKAAGKFSGTGRLIVHFQPQHIAERAFFYVNDDDKPPSNSGAPASAPSTSNGNEPRLEPPIESVLANPSRLVLQAPPAGVTGDYTIEGLLDWKPFTLNVSPSAKPPDVKFTLGHLATSFLNKYMGTMQVTDPKPPTKTKKASGNYNINVVKSNPKKKTMNSNMASMLDNKQYSVNLKTTFENTPDMYNMFDESFLSGYIAAINAKPPIRVPLSSETVIEYPYRLMISPNKYAGWAHSAKAKTDETNGRTELWHTRLGVRMKDGTVNEEAKYFRTVRAIWSPDVGTDYLMPAKYKERPFRTSINRRDRHELVQLTSNYDLNTKDEPVDVNQLMLTSLGAWADMAGVWDPKGSDSLDVEQWIQRGTQGRDHFVRICYKGFLFPFGHRATLVKETERKFRRTPRGEMAAYLMQRLYIILRQPVREFPANGVQGMHYQGRDIPFRKITITTKTTPNLKLPVALNGMSSNSFWPIWVLNGTDQDVQWTCIGRDWDNNDIHFSTPLAFLANTDACSANCQGWITNNYKNENGRRTPDMNGQNIAFAPSIKKNDTTFPTSKFHMLGYYTDTVVPDTPRFFPSMEKASVSIDKVNELLGTNEPREVEYFLPYLKYAFEAGTPPAKGANSVNMDSVKNTSQIFLNLLTMLGMDFNSKSDKSGGLAAPSIDIGALSRLMGPVPGDFTLAGNFADEAAKLAAIGNKVKDAVVAAGNFDPMQYFEDLLKSKILGDITLQDVLDFVQNVLSNIDKMPGLDKKDDFGVDDKMKEAASKSEIVSMLTDKLSEVDSVKQAADQITGAVNNEVEAAKEKLKDIVDEIKDKINDAKNDIQNEVQGAKNYVENQLKEWKKKVEDAANELKSEIEKAIKPLKEAGNEAYKMYEEASDALSTLKKGLNLVLEWSTEIKSTPGNILVPMYPGTADELKKAVLYLKAEVKKKLDLNPPEVNLYGSLSNFVINLIGDGSAQFLIIKFNRLAVSATIGQKPNIDPDIEAVEFAGPLTFVNKLKDLIPSGGGAGGVGFSFSFDVQPKGITAQLTITLPNVTVGAFSLQNMSFLMRLTIPFDGRPFTAYFAFCSRESPFRITIMVFGGGGFFGIEISPKGVRMLEAAFEFGGNFAFDCGVASGGASVMAGIYYKLEVKEIDGKDVEQSELTGYFRLTGNLSVLGIIRVSLLFELKLTWKGNGKVFGTATIEVTIEILFISFSVGVTVEKQLKGEPGDPTFADMLPQASMWEEYCNAFA